ncbi:MAG: aminomethyl-transferring glycine dehydrogenase [Fuerstiella sp.]|nr:aminomethyl-transferring glycine dehydrogenase [Fuerstiella sp.]
MMTDVIAKASQINSQFDRRHLGTSGADAEMMARQIGYLSVDDLIDSAVPAEIRRQEKFSGLPKAKSEQQALDELADLMNQNQLIRSLIGTGYYACITPPVLLRNILENPGWYTAYTPYQPEISQGRLEACLVFQTLITELSGLPVSNASLLDESTAAAEAMAMCLASRRDASRFLVSAECHPQTIAVLRTRAEPLGIQIEVGEEHDWSFDRTVGGILLQYPGTSGGIGSPEKIVAEAQNAGVMTVMACDLLSLMLLESPGTIGADIAVGSAQRFGVPMGFGGPHAGWIACTDRLKRKLPGRIVGVSRDASGKPAFRLSLQTREQHIRREKATSNICTAQVLLAVVAGMYAAWHGPDGLKAIAQRIHDLTCQLAVGLISAGFELRHSSFFDTLRVVSKQQSFDRALAAGFNLRRFDNGDLGISLDEQSSAEEICSLLKALTGTDPVAAESSQQQIPVSARRQGSVLNQPVFQCYHTETEMMRYLHQLESRDLALNTSMIPLGSCTMKLNAAAEMIPLSWPAVSQLHPFVPAEQSRGYQSMISRLENWLAACTGFDAVSVQPNAGSQGELAGLLAIREFHRSQDQQRDVCLIPISAHGTNPASAVMAGMKVVSVNCDDEGNIDLGDLQLQAEKHAGRLAALMITYPSTHGVFETGIRDMCNIVHEHGGQVYMDGANLNAQLGLCSPAELGADVCHLNLHKTFCIPHGGGGPGVGPIGVAEHLAEFLPGHPWHLERCEGAIAGAPYGSASILTISWMYIAMMGADGLTQATRMAILNANYVAQRLEPYFPVLYRGANGLVAHECILDLRPLCEATGLLIDDVAKRLMDFGFHAPTMSWPVVGTLMIEPTESESQTELDRFCDALIAIHAEMKEVESGKIDAENSVLRHAPHTAECVTTDDWNRSYARSQAAYPAPWLKDFKYWPPVGRLDQAFGDRNLVCTCPDMATYVHDESI